MRPPTGRHRRPQRTWAEHVWHIAAAALALALAHVLLPPRTDRPALDPAPERPRPPLPRRTRALADETFAPPFDDPGALVRPYMPPPPRRAGGEEVAPGTGTGSGEFDELANLIRVYLDLHPGGAD
ncbi:hypothetical protein [Nocardiopsis sp. NRRL B-16309]|uniref:hypothetical protein n=1 Tax=Nocardiopsis sp. NRRL B-16309 TaxID=1519494 RepID=UPI000ABEB39C|nr:hypothetical protein [Nocardiopsis sp. NRRL B-16309]